MKHLTSLPCVLIAALLVQEVPSERAPAATTGAHVAARTSDSDVYLRLEHSSGGAQEVALGLAELPHFPPRGRVIDVLADLAPGSESNAVLGVVIETDAETTYHFAVAFQALGEQSDAPVRVLSEPILRTHGEPYRILNVTALGGDALEMTLRRGTIALPHGASDPAEREVIDELVFADVCALAPHLAPGKSKLVDVQTGAAQPFGALR